MKSGWAQTTKLKRIRWHLQNSGNDDSVEMNLAWAHYLVAISDFDSATKRYRSAAEVDPVYWLNIVLIHEKLNQQRERKSAIVAAETALTTSLTQSPENENVRLALAELYLKLGQLDKCNILLQTEAEHDLLPAQLSPALKRVRAKLLIAKSLQHSKPGVDTGSPAENLKLARELLNLNPGGSNIHQVVKSLYERAESKEDKAAFISMLKSFSQESKGSAHAGNAEFVLGTIYGFEREFSKAIAELETALQLKPDDARRSNLLAQFLASGSNQDTDRAEELATNAVTKVPGNPEYRLTLGVILRRSSKYLAATTELKKALLLSNEQLTERGRTLVHDSLADCYRHLGQLELAQSHALRASKKSQAIQ